MSKSKTFRKKHKLTRVELAVLTGYSPYSIRNMELGTQKESKRFLLVLSSITKERVKALKS